ncbi:MAG: type II toxin-antitoxin system PemK/MazF family toxin [Candidatus Aenigmarchaeota archaeon]|nr:type II toxin-antitoxin system PemK/MazF family toxin [Candidatus Aenigmarchaeota archaeon]
MKKGDIWFVKIPLANGHEQGGTRPVLILSESEANTVIIIPFTSNIQALRFIHTIEVIPSQLNGLKSKSIALTFQMRAIDRKRLISKMGVLENNTLKEIERMIKKVLVLG